MACTPSTSWRKLLIASRIVVFPLSLSPTSVYIDPLFPFRWIVVSRTPLKFCIRKAISFIFVRRCLPDAQVCTKSRIKGPNGESISIERRLSQKLCRMQDLASSCERSRDDFFFLGIMEVCISGGLFRCKESGPWRTKELLE